MAKGIKTGGRKVGAKNKDKAPAQEIADRLGIDPFEILLYFAAGDYEALGYDSEMRTVGFSSLGDAIEDFTITPAIRQRAAKDACEFLLPKKKSIEHTGKDGKDLVPATYTTQWRTLPDDDKAS